MNSSRSSVPRLWYFLKAVAHYLFSPALRLQQGNIPPGEHDIPADYCGICVATSLRSDCDDYILEKLRELGIKHVRLDFSYNSHDNQSKRLLQTLLDNDFRVMLHLVQPLEAARAMECPDEQARWREFLTTALDTYGQRIEMVEVGSAVNRHRWSGYSLNGFLACWDIAFQEIQRRNIKLAGPNVNDFEPFYTIALLDLLGQQGQLPDYYTNNLFVERATEPEAYDHKVLGRRLARLVRYNLVRKARQLQLIAQSRRVSDMLCSYVTWTLPRIRRFLPDAETKQADYLSRYLLLAAASGAFRRVYWGALINSREGLIDDPDHSSPNGEVVALYDAVNGPRHSYRPRPALAALHTFSRLIPGTRFQGSLVNHQGLQVLEFTNTESRLHVAWTMNGQAALFADLYAEEDLRQATWMSRDGETTGATCLVTESPIYLVWPLDVPVSIKPGAKPLADLAHYQAPGRQCYYFRDAAWQGMVCAASQAEADRLLAALHPDAIDQNTTMQVLRDSRNRVWTISDPRDASRRVVVKQPVKLSWNKQLTEPFKPSKAIRSWSGASQLLRRGIDSPHPLLYAEKRVGTDLLRNWYVCEMSDCPHSVRDYFACYTTGETHFQGVSLNSFLRELCRFVLNMHQRGVHFRDLSAGNVLVHHDADHRLQFSLIDTARARFQHRALPMHRRLSDLVRILYKLHWPGRLQFLEQYFSTLERPLTRVHILRFHFYDLKSGWKSRLKYWKRSRRLAVLTFMMIQGASIQPLLDRVPI